MTDTPESTLTTIEPAASAPEPAAPTTWYGAVDDPALVEFAQRFPTGKDALTALHDARRKLSRAVFVPGDDATPEDRAAWHKALGVPEKPDAYSYTRADGDPLFEQFRAAAHAAGMPDKQFAAVMQWYDQTATAAQSEREARYAEQTSQAKRELQRWWGSDYDTNLRKAAMFVKRALGEDRAQALLDVDDPESPAAALLNRPELLEALRVAYEFQRDTDSIPISAGDMRSLQEEHERLTGEIVDAVARRDTKAARAAQDKRDRVSALMPRG